MDVERIVARGWKNLKEEANLKMDENDAGAISLRKSNKEARISSSPAQQAFPKHLEPWMIILFLQFMYMQLLN